MNRVKRNKNKKSLIFKILVVIVSISAIFIGGSVGIKSARYLSTLYLTEDYSTGKNSQSPSNANNPDPDVRPDTVNLTPEKVLQPDNPGNKDNNKIIISPACLPSNYKDFYSQVLVNRKPVNDYTRGYNIEFSGSEGYSALEGVTCFRGNNYRIPPVTVSRI